MGSRRSVFYAYAHESSTQDAPSLGTQTPRKAEEGTETRMPQPWEPGVVG